MKSRHVQRGSRKAVAVAERASFWPVWWRAAAPVALLGLLWTLLPALAQEQQQWQIASPGYRYEFPRDHFNHPSYQTEWWYYTGNLHSADGRRFGFELTFFRTGIHLSRQVAQQSDAMWRPDQIYLAHLALSDLTGRRFYHSERLNRAGPGLAGCSIQGRNYWNGNWQVSWKSLTSGEETAPRTAGSSPCLAAGSRGLCADEQSLQAVAPEFTLQLDLQPSKPAVIQGQNGVSQKGPEASQASHYISFTRMAAKGTLHLGDSALLVDGLAWMDHEFFSESRNSNLAGWDWFAIQLDDNQELMLYRLRQKSGQPDPYSSGTFVDSRGGAHFLSAGDFSLRPGGSWQSPHSKARYPVDWELDVPSLELHLSEATALSDQELFSSSAVTPSYWEGAVSYTGRLASKPVTGIGYLEMTGYDKPVWLRER